MPSGGGRRCEAGSAFPPSSRKLGIWQSVMRSRCEKAICSHPGELNLLTIRYARGVRRKCNNDREEGFTLIELLVAVTLLALLSIALFGALRFGTIAWRRSEQTTVTIDDVRVTQAVLRQLIAAAYPHSIAADDARRRIDVGDPED